jgi:hypothetical protein
MSVSIAALKTSRLFRGAAFLVSLLFITGQLFDCCRVNESFAHAVLGFFRHGDAKPALAEAGEDAHPRCHGHAIASRENRDPQAGSLLAEKAAPAESEYAQDGSCLSEKAFSKKPMVASEFAPAPIPLLVVGWAIQPDLPPSFFCERPRPQNKSSPPLYLTTLRLLV